VQLDRDGHKSLTTHLGLGLELHRSPSHSGHCFTMRETIARGWDIALRSEHYRRDHMDFMLDSDAIGDLVQDHPVARDSVVERHAKGDDRFMVTSVQRWQKGNYERDDEHRDACLDFVTALELVPSEGFLLGPGILGFDRLANPDDLADYTTGGRHPGTDAIIGLTATREGAVLVTRDKALTKKAVSAGLIVWDTARLVEYVTG
jgi:hypothetical protein